MSGVTCRTKRPRIASRIEAEEIARRVRKGAQAVKCPYCGSWHVVGNQSVIERPSKPRRRRL